MITAKKEFILVDGFNLFHRMLHMTNPANGLDTMIGMSLHLMLYSMKKEWNTFGGSHTVFFTEGRSWRKDFYTPYKANRAVSYALKTEEEKKNQVALTETFDDLVNFFRTRSNVSVLQNPIAEADDMIAVWIKMHPNDNHTLISSDSDFYQLLAPNVRIYDPVKDILITTTSVTNDKGKNMSFVMSGGKLTKLKADPLFKVPEEWWKYALFLKIVRGDSTDNVFSAYPGVREAGTKNSVGIKEAYEDRNNKGYSWNNFMLQKFMHHDGTEHRVLDDFNRNATLIDLTKIPEEIVKSCEAIIDVQINAEPVVSLELGFHFMKFCNKYELKKIGDFAKDFMPMLKATYGVKHLKEELQ